MRKPGTLGLEKFGTKILLSIFLLIWTLLRFFSFFFSFTLIAISDLCICIFVYLYICKCNSLSADALLPRIASIWDLGQKPAVMAAKRQTPVWKGSIKTFCHYFNFGNVQDIVYPWHMHNCKSSLCYTSHRLVSQGSLKSFELQKYSFNEGTFLSVSLNQCQPNMPAIWLYSFRGQNNIGKVNCTSSSPLKALEIGGWGNSKRTGQKVNFAFQPFLPLLLCNSYLAGRVHLETGDFASRYISFSALLHCDRCI